MNKRFGIPSFVFPLSGEGSIISVHTRNDLLKCRSIPIDDKCPMATDPVQPDEMEPGEKIEEFSRCEFRHACSFFRDRKSVV